MGRRLLLEQIKHPRRTEDRRGRPLLLRLSELEIGTFRQLTESASVAPMEDQN
jgi:hypothetical protein